MSIHVQSVIAHTSHVQQWGLKIHNIIVFGYYTTLWILQYFGAFHHLYS